MNHNTAEVGSLNPDYLGFIFYEGSTRTYTAAIPALPKSIKKVGVFVGAPLDFVIQKVIDFQLDVIQLHGDESPEYCKSLNKCLEELGRKLLDSTRKTTSTALDQDRIEGSALSGVEVWKVFSIKDHFDFEKLNPYEDVVQAFLFDTKGQEKGGNGYPFNWDVLKAYPSKKPFVLSGGIGLEEISALKKLLKTKLPILAIDVNSKFELAPGLKNIEALQKLIKKLN